MKDTVLSPSGQAHDAAEQAVQFLKRLDASGWHNLAAIDPNGGAPISRSFAPGSWAEIAEWVSHWSGQRNLYYTVNEVREGFGNAKPGKSDIANVRALFVDLDPEPAGELEAERARIKSALERAPVLFGEIVDSGRGYQALAIFAEKRRATDAVRGWAEQYGRGLCAALGGDAVQNVDRLLRLPGPLNIPTPAKRAKGYVEAKPARVIRRRAERIDAADVEARVKPMQADESTGDDEAIYQVQRDIEHSGYDLNNDFQDLPGELRAHFEEDLGAYPGLAKIWGGQIKSADQSGSAFRFALAGALQGTGRYGAEDYAHLAYVWPHSVRAGDDRDEKLTPRQLARDWARAQPTRNAQLDPSVYFEPIPAEAEDGAEWGEPLDIFGAAAPLNISSPPAGSLPAVLDRWAESESRRKGVPKAFAAAAALSAVAGALGNGLTICPRLRDTDWRVPCCLWVALVDDPGGGKSPIISAALRPLRELDGERFRAAKPALERWEAEQRGKRKTQQAARPRLPRTLVDDATMEKLISLFEENPRGLMQTPDELAQVFGALGAYKANGTADRSQLLRLFDGGGITVDRVGGGTKRAERALLSILAGTQPDRISKSVRDLGADGMLQRFLFVVGDGVDRAGGDDVEPDRTAANDYAALVKYLAIAEFGADPVRLSEAAYRALEDAKRQIQALAKYPGASVAWEGHVAKWAGILPRIALAFHAVELWGCQKALGFVPAGAPLEEQTAARAVAFGKFLLRHSLAFYERNFDAAPAMREARSFAGYLLTHPEKAEFTRRDIGQAQRSLRDPKAALSAMRRLEEVDWIRPTERGADGPSRWAVNPAVYACFKERAAAEEIERKRKQAAIARAGAARNEWLVSETVPTGGV
ncbi:DUF3987 domain-containing protein [Thioclava nitratireducens]|uniref:DUF3987 domain-containing protein n=1 Tax=Thioclava nitratireducens TaxID=1915078 RepID=UPI00247FB31D|nr:DUF3987 domain-containing protein [Thioclava nitratireducens]WGT48906.1 DUF3987 domain-containing protein [Thioclava nitratireducens]